MVRTRKTIQDEEAASYAAVTRMTRSKKGGAGVTSANATKLSSGKVMVMGREA